MKYLLDGRNPELFTLTLMSETQVEKDVLGVIANANKERIYEHTSGASLAHAGSKEGNRIILPGMREFLSLKIPYRFLNSPQSFLDEICRGIDLRGFEVNLENMEVVSLDL